jgi:hypothetical protein
MTTYTHYPGDLNVEYGGTFFNLEDWEYGYVSALRVTDLSSGCGFDGAVLVEELSIIIDDKEIVERALECCGTSREEIEKIDDEDYRKLHIAESVLNYGNYDPANSYYEPEYLVVQCDPEGSCKYDGWTANIKLEEGCSLSDWLHDTYDIEGDM